jgi:heme-degrading monooxygenase HmoA
MPSVRVTVLSADPGRFADIERFANERLIPAIRQQPGFRHYTSAGDRASGHGVAISEWETLEQAQAGAGAAFGLGQEIADLSLKVEAVYVYEVVAQV